MIDRKILDRVEKLLRLAAPGSGAEEPERASAALKAAEMIAQHDLVVRERERKLVRRPAAPRPRQDARPPARPSWVAPDPSPPGWVRSVAARDGTVCADPDCGEPVMKGDPVWMRFKGFEVEYLHISGNCGWN